MIIRALICMFGWVFLGWLGATILADGDVTMMQVEQGLAVVCLLVILTPPTQRKR